jgi:outer membrane protein assembly factor BamB
VAALAVAGCSGGSDDSAAPEPRRNIVPRVLVTVQDGDTGRPLAGVRVRGVERWVTTRTDPDGEARLVGPVETIAGSAHGYGADRVPVKRGVAALELHDRRLQSRQYGGGPARRRHLPAVRVGPPNKKPTWTFDARTLIEFPPVVEDGLMAFGTNGGRVFALDATTGKPRWDDRLSGAIASSPSIIDGIVYVTAMDGTLTAYRGATGAKLWRFRTGSPIESSPLVVDGRIYFGDWAGVLYAVDARSGRVRWKQRAAGQIKGSAALADGKIVIGDYAGRVHAHDPKTGAKRWTYSGGTRFYGGPAAAEGRVIIGDVGGAVHALSARTGRPLWRHSTGGAYVYASPALARGAAYIGSYNGKLQALDLRTGRVRWSFDVGGRISGSATVVGGVAYAARLYADGQPRRTVGVRIDDGKLVHENADGRYTPAVGAGNRLYLVGTRKVYAYAA